MEKKSQTPISYCSGGGSLEELLAEQEFAWVDESRDWVIKSPVYCPSCPFCGHPSMLRKKWMTKLEKGLYQVICTNGRCANHFNDTWADERLQAIQAWRLMVKLTDKA